MLKPISLCQGSGKATLTNTMAGLHIGAPVLISGWQATGVAMSRYVRRRS